MKTVMSDHGLRIGTPAVHSVGAITFGPDGILFVADNREAKIFAIDVRDTAAPGGAPIELDALDDRIAAYLGCGREDISIRDMAVHPSSHAVYLSVMRGVRDSALPVIAWVAPDGAIGDVALRGVPFSEVAIEHAPSLDDSRFEFRMAGKIGRAHV